MNKPLIARKQYTDKLKKYIDKPIIKVITGIRRSGKSELLKLLTHELSERGIASDQIVYINMELLSFDFIRNYRHLHQYVTDKCQGITDKIYLFVDEIQEIENWEKAISSFFAEGNYDIYITGSNAHLLSSEISTLLSGRYIEVNLYTLSFQEFCFFRDDRYTDPKTELQLYLQYGGFPVVHFMDYNAEIIHEYILSLYNTILLKDVVARYNIRNVALFENLVKYVFDNIGNIFSATSISKYLKSQQIKIGVDTIGNYLQYLTNSLLLHKVQRYDIKGKNLLETHEKYYLADIGLKNALLGYREQDIAGILENMVYLKLLQLDYSVYIGKYLDYEIDFVAERAGERIYVQVSYLINTEATREREYRVLELLPDNYTKYVVTMDDLPRTNTNGIIRMHVLDFLNFV